MKHQLEHGEQSAQGNEIFHLHMSIPIEMTGNLHCSEYERLARMGYSVST